MPEDGPTEISLTGTFKTYEFYGVLLSTFLDIFIGKVSKEIATSVAQALQNLVPGSNKMEEEIAEVLKRYGKGK